MRDMSFSDALDRMRAGDKVCRTVAEGRISQILRMNTGDGPGSGTEVIVDQTGEPYRPSQADILALDWEVLPPEGATVA